MFNCKYNYVFLVAKVLIEQEFDLKVHKLLAMCGKPERVSVADGQSIAKNKICLLYTSDAADE